MTKEKQMKMKLPPKLEGVAPKKPPAPPGEPLWLDGDQLAKDGETLIIKSEKNKIADLKAELTRALAEKLAAEDALEGVEMQKSETERELDLMAKEVDRLSQDNSYLTAELAVAKAPLPVVGDMPKRTVEVKTLKQSLSHGCDFADKEFAGLRNDGWQLLNMAISTIAVSDGGDYPRQIAEITRIVTMERERIVETERPVGVETVVSTPEPVAPMLPQAVHSVSPFTG